MTQLDGSAQPGPYRHCALCPATAFSRLAQLPDAGRRHIHPVIARPSTAPPNTPLPAHASRPAIPALTDAVASSVTDLQNQLADMPLAEAALLFWSDDRHFEARLAALPNLRLFDWTGTAYRERRVDPPSLHRSTADEDAPGGLAAGPSTGFRSVPERSAAASAPGFIPNPLYLAFETIPGVVTCHVGAGLPLGQTLRLPPANPAPPAPLPGNLPGRISGPFATGTPARGVPFVKPSMTPRGGTRIPSPSAGVPIVVASGLVALRLIPAPLVPSVQTDTADSPDQGTLPAHVPSSALLLPFDRREELLTWLGAAPPTRTQGLVFAVLPDALWIDRLAPSAADLPPFLTAERLSPHTGSIGSTLWLRTGAAWSPPLAVDLLLDRFGAAPHCDYVLQPDPNGLLRCRYLIDRNRLLPFERATVRATFAALPPLPPAGPAAAAGPGNASSLNTEGRR